MKKLLVIEDEDVLREKISLMLQLSGYACSTAENGRAGLRKALTEQYDLIICDIMMPDLDGFQVLEELQQTEHGKTIPFIFLTAKSEMEDLRTGMGKGADDYLTKPFKKEELVQAIEARLRKVKDAPPAAETGNVEDKQFAWEDKMFINLPTGIAGVQVKDISHISAEGSYTHVHTIEGKKHIVRKLLGNWEKILPEKYFARIHRSYIVNFLHIQAIERDDNDALLVTVKNGKEQLRVGRQYASVIKNKLLY